MLRTTRTPVTLYTSEDPGAPKLARAAGSLKTVLKACLVTGYGSKPAAGWEAAFEDGNKIALRSADAKSPQGCLRVEHTNANYADLRVYTAMSGIDAGAAAGALQRFPIYEGNTAVRRWWLVGCPRGFVFFSEGAYTTRPLYFGDFPTLAAGDNGNMVFAAHANGTYGNTTYSWNGLNYISGTRATSFLLKSHDGLAAAAEAVFSSAGALSVSSNNYSADYPSPVSGGFSAFPVFIAELVGIRRVMRGLLPGLSCPAENLSAVSVGTEFAIGGDRYILMEIGDDSARRSPVLVNISAWEL